MAKLERGLQSLREDLQEGLQAVDVLLQVRRKLKEDRTQPIAQAFRRLLHEVAQRVVGFLQALVVRDSLAGLQDEGEVVRDFTPPLLEHLDLRDAVERVVDLHAVEPRAVVGQHARLGQVFGVEGPLPLLVGEAARSRP